MNRPRSDRNLYLFAMIVALQYLAAPVIYVGITQGSLLDALGANPILSNIPSASFFVMATLVTIISWAFPKVRHLKPVLVSCYALAGLTAGVTAWVLQNNHCSANTKILAVIAQSGITGATIPTAIAFLWEILGRSTEPSRRGVALGLAYGVGPLLAALGSLVSQLILAGHFSVGFFAWKIDIYEMPLNFSLLFGVISPVMFLASLLASQFVIPLPSSEVARRPATTIVDLSLGILLSTLAMIFSLFSNLILKESGSLQSSQEAVDELARQGYQFFSALFGQEDIVRLSNSLMIASSLLMILAAVLFAYHFRDLLQIRIIRILTISTLLFYVGNVIPTNMNLYSKSVLQVDPAEYAGYQNLMRFSFKAVAGLALGFLLTKTNPRSGILVTGMLYVAALTWAMIASGKAYLLAFGIFGAGELIGVYAPNYMLSVCHESQMKRGQVLMNLLMGPVGQMGIIFGWIATALKPVGDSLEAKAIGFRMSFAVCILILITGIVMTLVALPKRPQPEDVLSR